MKVILAVVCITFVYIFSMVNLEGYRNQLLDKFNPSVNNQQIHKPNNDSNKNDFEIIEKISVTISGQVDKPGTYTINKDSTLDDLIKKVGLTDFSADESCFDRDLVLEDKMNIYIPKDTDFKISINNGNKEELMMLAGIGEATADRIIEYRNKMGENCFKCLDDIKKVSGIKELTFNKIRDYIKL